jgi:hypothetical protein
MGRLSSGRPAWFLIVSFLLGILAAYLVSRAYRIVDEPPEASLVAPFNGYDLASGDLILTSNATRNPIDSGNLIKVLTDSAFHHAAIVWRQPETGQVLVWEMNATATRLANATTFLADTPRKRIFTRRLVCNTDSARRLPDAALQDVIARQWEHHFNYDVARIAWRRVQSAVRPLCGAAGRAPCRRRTCAHMVAEAYLDLGVFRLPPADSDDTGRPAEVGSSESLASIMPGDFEFDDRLPLAPEWSFGPLVELTYESGGFRLAEKLRAAREHLLQRQQERPRGARDAAADRRRGPMPASPPQVVLAQDAAPQE